MEFLLTTCMLHDDSMDDEYLSFAFGPTTKDPSSQICFSLECQALLERAAGKALTLAEELELNKSFRGQ